jgi:hypothetical protein
MSQNGFRAKLCVRKIAFDSSIQAQFAGEFMRQKWRIYGNSDSKLFTSTNASNERMQRLCERLGYVRSGPIEHLDEDDPELVYFKRLSNQEV